MPPHDSTTTPLQKSSHPLHVLIIGAGPCGLSSAIAIAHAGHRVTVFESVPQLHEVGAGLQITPNGSRLLRRWGVDDALLAAETATPAWLRIQRFSGELLAQRTGYEQEVRRSYGSPLWGLHRVDLQSALARRARELGVTILLATKVVDVDFEAPAVTLVDGERVVGDLVVAADGLWSSTRSRFLGRDTTPQPTGHMAYRILVPAEQVANNEHRSWMAEPGTNIWIGPEAHAVAYSICQGKLLNVVVLVKDDLAADVKKASGNMEELKSRLSDWDPMQDVHDPFFRLKHD